MNNNIGFATIDQYLCFDCDYIYLVVNSGIRRELMFIFTARGSLD